MGNYADNLKKKKAEAALNDLLNKETDNDKIESLKEVLNLLSATDDGTTKLGDVIDAKVEAAITAAIGTGGVIETWGDGRYAAKQE